MYSSFQLAKKYLHYYIKASNGKGHGIHSPFVFDFVMHVLNDRKKYKCYEVIEPLRNKLLHNNTIINVEDFGAGSALIPFKKRKINAIAKSSLKNKKFAQLLFRIVNYYKPSGIIELGTSLGITTCYLACGNANAEVFTFEGSEEIGKIAKEIFSEAALQNAHLIQGNFDKTFLPALDKIEKIDFAFVDGNHRKKATLSYFFNLLKKSTSNSIFIFDDIHWSLKWKKPGNKYRSILQ
jgi:Predicted O-methyltransferase